MDTLKTAKSHTEKNITAAYNLLAEKYPAGCAPALVYEDQVYLHKAESQGNETIIRRMERIWSGDLNEHVLYLPAASSFEEALALCEEKEKIFAAHAREKRSINNLVLVYVGRVPSLKLKEDKGLRDRYHQAILSNLFVDVDGVSIFDNRSSIFEALIEQSFGASSEQVTLQVAHQFFHEA